MLFKVAVFTVFNYVTFISCISNTSSKNTCCFLHIHLGRDLTENDGIYSGTFPQYLRNVTNTERFSLLVIREFRFLAWKLENPCQIHLSIWSKVMITSILFCKLKIRSYQTFNFTKFGKVNLIETIRYFVILALEQNMLA